MNELNICLGGEQKIKYRILFKNGLKEIFESIHRNYSKIAIVTDTNLDRIYGEEIGIIHGSFWKNPLKFVIKAGEGSKTRKTKEQIEDWLIQNQIDRKSALVAIGGGVVGDITGFCASTYMRGIDYIQVPTTLLAMVDSSIGGKTAVNTKCGKNIIGTFYHPKGVFIDLGFLKTLPEEEKLNGYAEMVKHCIISGEPDFSFLLNNADAVKNGDINLLKKSVIRSIAVKKSIVEKDERETKLRKVLNFGHTVGHAVEKLSSYNISHGVAVAVGMAVESRMAKESGLISTEDYESIISLITKFGLPKKMEIDMSNALRYIQIDKKNEEGHILFSLPTKIGSIKSNVELDHNIIVDILEGKE